MEKIVAQLKNIFFQGTRHYAKAKEREGTVSYEPLEGAPSDKDLKEHLQGKACWGSYTLLPDSTVRWICLDVDASSRQKARNITEAISEILNDIPHGIEFSGNKGYHIWLFLAEPVPAKAAKAYGIQLREAVGAPSSGDPHVEVFPKQDSLTSSSPMGNLVKLPLGLHPKSHNRSIFVDRRNGWEAGEEVDPLSILTQRVDFKELEKNLIGNSPMQKLSLLLGGYWVNGERHNLALALSGFLASLGWKKDDVSALVTELVKAHGGDETNLQECVTTTFKRLAAGKQVQGFSALNEQLPVNVMRTLSDLAGQNIADPAVQVIDRIRLEKGPIFLKTRSAGNAMRAHLTDTGKFVRTETQLYWLDLSSHRLLAVDSLDWMSLVHSRFGINPKESFGIQALEDLRLSISGSLEISKVYKRFHWDGQTLYLNFGGAEVYCLNGNKNERRLSYNGEEDFLFLTGLGTLSEDLSFNLFEQDPLDPWEHLTNDLSFAESEANQANNEQQHQLLKAWILQLFFGNILSTRPIALFTGPRGSGKTTAARRILRFFEGFDEDVLGIAEDKPDSLRASIEDRLVLTLDNMEKTRVRWLDNFLNRLATGAQIELRQLYKSNEKYKIRPNVFVLATGIELPTQEESLYSRMLPLELQPLEQPRPEYLMQSRLKDNLSGAWAGMLNYLDSVIRELRTVSHVEVPNSSRLADFVVFCHRIQGCDALNGPVLKEGLNSLVRRQNQTMGQSSAALIALEAWLEECYKSRIVTTEEQDPLLWRNSGDLFRVLRGVSERQKIRDFRWTTPASFSRHWLLLTQGGLRNITFESQKKYNPANKREEVVFRFPRIAVKEDAETVEIQNGKVEE
jgi:DNA polymerase III delta prime subunit